MIEIIKGVKHFKPPQPGYELVGCNAQLKKKVKISGKVFHPGWCLTVSKGTLDHWIEKNIAVEFKASEYKVEKSQILDKDGDEIEKIIEES